MALSVPRLLPTKTYPFSDIRHTLAATGIQPGVLATGATTEFKVTQDTGSNMNVKIAAGDSGAWVTGSDTTRQGAYHVYNDAIDTRTVSAAHATLPRIDQLVLRIYDSNVIGGGTDAGAFEVIAGTATAGAQATNAAGANYRAGAANLATIAAPKTLIRLADILVPAASTAVTNANIVDRRTFALGATRSYVRTAGDYTTASATYVAIDSTNLSSRIECSGVPLRVALLATFSHSQATNTYFAPFVDGTILSGGERQQSVSATFASVLSAQWVWTPAAGSHVIDMRWRTDATTATLKGGATQGLHWVVEEIVRQNTDNT